MQECVVCKRTFEYSGDDLELGTCSSECTFQYLRIVNHKGSFCRLAKIFCQEGYCYNCVIYQDFKAKKGDLMSEGDNQEKPKREQHFCPVCEKNSQEKNLPTCQECFNFFITFLDHRGRPCWITLEVFCQQGYCSECQIFRLEKEIQKRGLNKSEIMGNY